MNGPIFLLVSLDSLIINTFACTILDMGLYVGCKQLIVRVGTAQQQQQLKVSKPKHVLTLLLGTLFQIPNDDSKQPFGEAAGASSDLSSRPLRAKSPPRCTPHKHSAHLFENKTTSKRYDVCIRKTKNTKMPAVQKKYMIHRRPETGPMPHPPSTNI